MYSAFEQLRKDHNTGEIPQAVTEEFMVLADRFSFSGLLRMCVDEFVHNPKMDVAKSVVGSETVSDAVKLLILERKLAKLNRELEKERKYKHDANCKATIQLPKTLWRQ